jgi:hypothetical protein
LHRTGIFVGAFVLAIRHELIAFIVIVIRRIALPPRKPFVMNIHGRAFLAVVPDLQTRRDRLILRIVGVDHFADAPGHPRIMRFTRMRL